MKEKNSIKEEKHSSKLDQLEIGKNTIDSNEENEKSTKTENKEELKENSKTKNSAKEENDKLEEKQDEKKENNQELQNYLNAIYQNCSTGLQSIHDILPKIEDEKLKQEVKQEYHGYQTIFRKCEDFAKKQDVMVKDNNWFKKARLYSSINMGTLTNRTTRKITEMLLLGTVMGLNECYKNKWDFHGINKELDEILEELCEFQDGCYKNLKGFLKKNI